MELPTDRPHPLGGLSAKGDSIGVRVPPHTAAALRRLTVENRTTLYVIMLSAWKVHAVLYNCSIGTLCIQVATSRSLLDFMHTPAYMQIMLLLGWHSKTSCRT